MSTSLPHNGTQDKSWLIGMPHLLHIHWGASLQGIGLGLPACLNRCRARRAGCVTQVQALFLSSLCGPFERLFTVRSG